MPDNYYVSLDVGGTKIASALMNDSGEILSRHKFAVPGFKNNAAFFDFVNPIIQQVIDECPSKNKIKGISLGVPGLVDETGYITNMPNLGLKKVNLADEIQTSFDLPCVIGNDVNLGLLGEWWQGSAKGKQTVIGLFPGTGIGGGIIFNGQLVVGVNGAAAELGHVIIDPNGPECSCGNKGCLEAFAGRWAIERDIKAAVDQGESSLAVELTDKFKKRLKSKVLKKCLKENDEVVTRIMKNVAKQLGLACINFRHTFDPQAIVFGGGVVEACGDFLLPKIQKIVDNDPFFKHFPSCPMLLSECGDDAVLLGGVALLSQS